eukprot:1139417-Pelagomonas_calceolata.AAC.4
MEEVESDRAATPQLRTTWDTAIGAAMEHALNPHKNPHLRIRKGCCPRSVCLPLLMQHSPWFCAACAQTQPHAPVLLLERALLLLQQQPQQLLLEPARPVHAPAPLRACAPAIRQRPLLVPPPPFAPAASLPLHAHAPAGAALPRANACSPLRPGARVPALAPAAGLAVVGTPLPPHAPLLPRLTELALALHASVAPPPAAAHALPPVLRRRLARVRAQPPLAAAAPQQQRQPQQTHGPACTRAPPPVGAALLQQRALGRRPRLLRA